MARVTQRDVAARVGVSREAVAFALSPDPRLNRQLGEETRQRIIKAAKQMQYVPNHAARRLQQSRSQRRDRRFDQAGLIYFPPRQLSDITIDLVCLSVLQGAEQVLSSHHASITFLRVVEPEDWDKVDRMMRSGIVDGWLLHGGVTDDTIAHMRSSSTPVVVVGDHRCTQPINAVNYDFNALGRLAVEHLAALGHRRIGYNAGSLNYAYQQQTLAGFRLALRDGGLDDRDDFIQISGRSHYQNLMDLIRDPDLRPTALFSLERGWAAEARSILTANRISIPGEMSILAGEHPLESVDPTITRFHLPMVEIGTKGASLLLRLAKEEDAAPTEDSIVPSILPGMSTAPPGS